MTLDVLPGEVVALLGPNGSGKSTLVRGPARAERPPGRPGARLFGTPDRRLPRPRPARLRAAAAHPRRPRCAPRSQEVVAIGPAAAPGLVRAAVRPRPGRRRRGARARRPRPTGPAPTSARSPAASSAGCSSPARSRPSPTCSSWTSRPPAWTPPASRCSPQRAGPAGRPRHDDGHRHPRARPRCEASSPASCWSAAGG